MCKGNMTVSKRLGKSDVGSTKDSDESSNIP